MKKNIKIWLIAAMAVVSGSVRATDQHFPKGKYYFDFTGVSATQIDIFTNIESGYVDDGGSTQMKSSDIDFDSSDPLNANVSQTDFRSYSPKAGTFTYLVLELKKDMKIRDDQSFFHFQRGGGWNDWQKFDDTNLTDLDPGDGKKFLGVVSESGIAWQTSGTIPSGTPVLTFKAGSNGGISTHTAGGSNISSPAPVTEGTSVNLVATPDTGYSFYGWVRSDGSVASTLANYVFSMPSSSLDLTATFYSDSTDPVINGDGCSGCFLVAP